MELDSKLSNFDKIEKLQERTLIILISLVLITILSIYICYGHDYFHKWNWMRCSLILSMFTILICFATAFFVVSFNLKLNTFDRFAIILFLMPFVFLLIYPGTEKLSIHSDSRAIYLMALLECTHGFFFNLLTKDIIKITKN